jgi:hypothetical protein
MLMRSYSPSRPTSSPSSSCSLCQPTLTPAKPAAFPSLSCSASPLWDGLSSSLSPRWHPLTAIYMRGISGVFVLLRRAVSCVLFSIASTHHFLSPFSHSRIVIFLPSYYISSSRIYFERLTVGVGLFFDRCEHSSNNIVANRQHRLPIPARRLAWDAERRWAVPLCSGSILVPERRGAEVC